MAMPGILVATHALPPIQSIRDIRVLRTVPRPVTSFPGHNHNVMPDASPVPCSYSRSLVYLILGCRWAESSFPLMVVAPRSTVIPRMSCPVPYCTISQHSGTNTPHNPSDRSRVDRARISHPIPISLPSFFLFSHAVAGKVCFKKFAENLTHCSYATSKPSCAP
jgi:hypothetical protein